MNSAASIESSIAPNCVKDVVGDQRWISMHQRHLKDPSRLSAKIFLLGDSLFERLNVQEIWDLKFQPLQVFNASIGGDQTQNLLYRLENGLLEGIQAKCFVVLIGTNNHQHNPQQVYEGILAVIQCIEKNIPSVEKILVLGILPRGKFPENPARLKNLKINQNLEKYISNITRENHAKGKENHLIYLDAGKYLLEKDGTISDKIMPDYLHFSKKGYEILTSKILENLP